MKTKTIWTAHSAAEELQMSYREVTKLLKKLGIPWSDVELRGSRGGHHHRYILGERDMQKLREAR